MLGVLIALAGSLVGRNRTTPGFLVFAGFRVLSVSPAASGLIVSPAVVEQAALDQNDADAFWKALGKLGTKPAYAGPPPTFRLVVDADASFLAALADQRGLPRGEVSG